MGTKTYHVVKANPEKDWVYEMEDGQIVVNKDAVEEHLFTVEAGRLLDARKKALEEMDIKVLKEAQG